MGVGKENPKDMHKYAQGTGSADDYGSGMRNAYGNIGEGIEAERWSDRARAATWTPPPGQDPWHVAPRTYASPHCVTTWGLSASISARRSCAELA